MDKRAELRDNLKYIRRVLSDSDTLGSGNGLSYIFWGILISVGQTATYLLYIRDQGRYIKKLWLVLILAGVLVSVVLYFKRRVKRDAVPIAYRIFRSTSIAVVISLIILVYAAPVKSVLGFSAINPVMSLLLGMAYFINGNFSNTKWLQAVSFGWWTGAVVLLLNPGPVQYPIFAVMMILFHVLPGAILSARNVSEK